MGICLCNSSMGCPSGMTNTNIGSWKLEAGSWKHISYCTHFFVKCDLIYHYGNAP